MATSNGLNVKNARTDEYRTIKSGENSRKRVNEYVNSYENDIELGIFLVFVVIGINVLATLSVALQLEKYVKGESGPPFLRVPFISNRSCYESLSLCVLGIICAMLLVSKQRFLILRCNLNMPMVPSNWPFFGTAFLFMTNSPWDLMESWHRKYGPIYAFKLLGQICVAIEDPDYLREVLQSKIKNVKKDVAFAYKPFLPILGRGIVTSEGKCWMRQRLQISTPLKVDVLDIIPRITLGAVQRLMIKMDRCAETGDTIDIAEELRHLTLQVISETFMSIPAEESDATFAKMYLPIVEESNKRVWSPERSYMFFMPFFWCNFYRVARLNTYVSNLIKKRWSLRRMERSKHANSREQDILDRVLIHYEKENPTEDLPLCTVRQIRDEFKTFMLAGHETSAAMMTWAFYELMKDKSLMKMVRLNKFSLIAKHIVLKAIFSHDYKYLILLIHYLSYDNAADI